MQAVTSGPTDRGHQWTEAQGAEGACWVMRPWCARLESMLYVTSGPCPTCGPQHPSHIEPRLQVVTVTGFCTLCYERSQVARTDPQDGSLHLREPCLDQGEVSWGSGAPGIPCHHCVPMAPPHRSQAARPPGTGAAGAMAQAPGALPGQFIFLRHQGVVRAVRMASGSEHSLTGVSHTIWPRYRVDSQAMICRSV